MKTTVFFFVTFFFVNAALSQLPPIDVTELTVKIGSMGSEELFYGFADGDQIVFSFEEINGKELKEIEIIELPGSSKFMDYKPIKIENKKITVQKKAVYQFNFKNSALAPRVCKVKIQRIPKSEDLIFFNTNWEWRTLYDTTYVPYTQDSLVGYDTIRYTEKIKELLKTERVDEMIIDKSQRVHSSMNLSNSNYAYLKVDMPQNITSPYREEKNIAWAYWIGVGEESSEAYRQNIQSIGKVASGVASVYGTPLAGVAVGAVTEMMLPQTGEDVRYAFVADFQNLQAFMAGQTYYQFDQGKGIAAFGKQNKGLQGTFYIGLHNDNNILEIDVNVKIVVVKEIKTYHDVVYNRMRTEPRYTKLNKKKMVVNSSKVRVNSE